MRKHDFIKKTPLPPGFNYGLVLGLIMIVVFAMRTLGEEKMLTKEFRDYEEYKQNVRHRIIPFVW